MGTESGGGAGRGGENRFAGTCGTDAPGVAHPFWTAGVKFLDEAGMRELNEEYQRLCEESMAAKVEQFQSLMRGWAAGEPGSGLTVGVDQGSGASVGGVSVVGPWGSYSFVTPSPEIESMGEMMRRVRQRFECGLLGVEPGVGLPKGVEVVREGVTASEVRSMAVNTPRAVLRSGDLPPELAWVKNYALRVVPNPTLEEVFGPDEPGFWWVRGTEWVRGNELWEGWASRCQLESQGSAEEQAEMMRRAESMLLRAGCGWDEDQLVDAVELGAWLADESPVLSALDRSLAGIGGHFPALWCWEVPLLGVWRSSWTWDDWRGAGDGSLWPVESIADHVVPMFQWCPSVHPCPAPSIGAQLGALGGPWPVLECLVEPVLNLTAWDHGLSAWCRGFNPGPSEWWCPESEQIPIGWREADCMFRLWLDECEDCPLKNGGKKP